MTPSCEIAVVGGGVVGASLAVALRQAGFDTRLVDRGRELPVLDKHRYDPRVYAISPASRSFLQQAELWNAIRGRRLSPYQAMRVWSRDPARALRFESQPSGGDEAAPLGWIIEQDALLEPAWTALPAEARHTGVSVQQAELDRPVPVLTLSDGSTLSARLVVSAQGGEANLRRLAGIDSFERSYEQTALVCAVQSGEPHRNTALQAFLPGGPLAFLPLADGRRSIVWTLPESQIDALMALPETAFHQRLAAAAHFEVGAVLGSTPRQRFPLRVLHARRYVRPGFALVGDSAHVIHPLAGQGANLGFADAAALLTVLSDARESGRDWASERCLARYERSRLAANQDMILLTDALNSLFRSPSPGLRGLLSWGLSAVDRLEPAKRALIRRALSA